MNDNHLNNILSKYNKALEVLKLKFNNYNQTLEKKKEKNPIKHIKYRLKSKNSIKHKLTDRLKLDYTIENIETNLYDIAGVRIICPFLSDIDKIITYINNDPDISIIKVKDYIKNPKPNGYSSYHLQVLIPITENNQKQLVKAEIQIRTLAIDAIASLEHKIIYKNKNDLPIDIKINLQEITKYVNDLDNYLNNFITIKKINSQTPSTPDKKTEEIFIPQLQKYQQALDKTESIINTIKNQYPPYNNPIEHVKSRLKPIPSICKKLTDKNLPITIENAEEYINDIAGIQIVCSFLSDIDKIINWFNNNPNFIILERQDYINNPKENGYSGYHLIIGVPINNQKENQIIKLEIQIRTVIMDFWANIEHILCYKKNADIETITLMQYLANNLRVIENNLNYLYLLSNKTDSLSITNNQKKLTKSI